MKKILETAKRNRQSILVGGLLVLFGVVWSSFVFQARIYTEQAWMIVALYVLPFIVTSILWRNTAASMWWKSRHLVGAILLPQMRRGMAAQTLREPERASSLNEKQT